MKRLIAPVLLLAGSALTVLSAVANPATSAAPADARIRAALNQISSKQIQATIEKLVSFGTRSTFSAQDPASISAGRGIGAARDWIKSEFERYSKECGGCLDVKVDAFIQQPVERV